MRCGEIGAARDRRRFAPFSDVVGRIEARVDPSMPLPSIAGWQFEFEWLPVGIENQVQQ